ncbi:MAG TPA: methyltransferase domain-containing protein [Solirubrobacterales bacterium]
MDFRAHWERIYGEKRPDEVSWFEPTPRISLELIDEAGIDRGAPVVDVGGGASRLAGELVARGYTDVTVADISGRSLAFARTELGESADRITWLEADVLGDDLGRRFALWHDRAVLHFMVDRRDRDAYLSTLRRSLAPDGQLVVATFGPEAPPTCSGLPVHRYAADQLSELLPDFELASSRYELHHTPGGKKQQFVYARFVRS